jgi:hypothetical protein
MYIYDQGSSASQPERADSTVLRPSEVYRYSDLQQPDSRSLGFVSFLGDLSGPLAPELRAKWNATKDKQAIFAMVRKQTSFPLSSAVKTELASIFAGDADALWMADKLAEHGPEPLWPLNDIKDRVAKVKSLGSDPGNYEAVLPDPKPGTSASGCIDKLSASELPHAFFFPGRDPRRALIISGVHSDETNGIDVVTSLQTLLTGSTKPFFTTILVPLVTPRTFAAKPKKLRNVPGGLGFNDAGNLVCREVEPNRNLPFPGEDLATAQARATTKKDPELVIRDRCGNIRPPRGPDRTSIRMLPETRILLSLIERFQPERLASVHAHSLMQDCHPCWGRATLCGGEGPGIFVDPRGIDPVTKLVTDLTKVQADDKLAEKMVQKGLSQLTTMGALMTSLSPFAGNTAFPPFTTRYFSESRVEGNSMGDWGPVDTASRLAMTTLTVEVPKSGFKTSAARIKVVELHRDLLRDIFLEP